MGLELYSKVEHHLDFEDEIYTLHKEFMTFVMMNELDNVKSVMLVLLDISTALDTMDYNI